MKKYMFGLLGFLLLTGMDQGTKWLAQCHLKGTNGVPIVSGVFELQYLENKGAAFGILQGRQIFLILLTVALITVLVYFFCRIPAKRRYFPMLGILVLIAAGAIGNMIDRIWHHYVIDFFYFRLIHFPIFNLADCYVVVGAFLACLFLCFVYPEEELAIFYQRSRKEETHES